MNPSMSPSVEASQDPLHRFDRSVAGMAVLDAGGNVVRANQALCDLLGHDREALIGSGWQELHDAADRPGAVETLLNLRTAGTAVHQACRRPRRGGGRAILVHLEQPPEGGGRGPGGTRDVRAARDATLAALGQRVLDGLELDPLMGEAVRSVADSLGVGHVAVLELRPGALVLRLRAAVGWDGDRLAQLLLGGPALAKLQSPETAGRPIMLPDLLGRAAATTLAADGVQTGAVATI